MITPIGRERRRPGCLKGRVTLGEFAADRRGSTPRFTAVGLGVAFGGAGGGSSPAWGGRCWSGRVGGGCNERCSRSRVGRVGVDLQMMVRSRSSRRIDPSQRSAKVLATGVWTGGFEDLEAFGSEDVVEGVDELAATVADEGFGVSKLIGVSEEQGCGLLGWPRRRWGWR